ncbi:ABC transporter ATP-binding protein [Mycolicibacterium confluentis]|uniref:Aliphatic sulfonates import ATP-binding protein SsuB 1 n=1 Tax=Mycolicibacterium confluentis TaxID=28047 RepID=A0A7I7XSB2_9MYCO|nr:ABC transporter ATP-binding protein [Mycolicibacterium confluentis]MCV7321415.1 ABC transporter ATP-binding protein [Mycolicibacterium confluentis]ORV33046.1 sulfonate ABC transporter ATP-binding protein [Mycolicibacterium confluentis]BBZ32101.1 aliphatic sulfonates import ATP-binding protein SsuB 1 [Mycolicibacterium confluentis]
MTDVMTSSVRVQNAVRRFGDRVVLDHLDLDIAESEFVVLLGPSGCGKSTLLRLLAGLDRPDGGEIRVPKDRAIVFQGARLLPWEKAWRNVTIGLTGGDAKAKALVALDEVGLAERADAWPKTLSGGEAQRVALARALVSNPSLVLLDEPFAALDAITRLRMHALVRDLRVKHNAAMLLVTHDVDEAIALGDRILVMQSGRIGRELRVALSAEERSHGLKRDELRVEMLDALGVANLH